MRRAILRGLADLLRWACTVAPRASENADPKKSTAVPTVQPPFLGVRCVRPGGSSPVFFQVYGAHGSPQLPPPFFLFPFSFTTFFRRAVFGGRRCPRPTPAATVEAVPRFQDLARGTNMTTATAEAPARYLTWSAASRYTGLSDLDRLMHAGELPAPDVAATA
jgi:hypothetical protein